MHSELWKKAMEEEMESLRKHETLYLVALLDGINPIGSKWVFKINKNEATQFKNFKARLESKGYSQVERVNFGEIFSPITSLTYIRLIMSLVAAFNLEIEIMDMKEEFLHQDFEEKIYMKYPKHFTMKEKKEMVCMLRKSIYGMKQSPRMLYYKLESYI